MKRKNVFRLGVLAGVVLAGAIQLVPVDRSNPPVRSEVPAPDDVKAILRESCYDCHSNETRWPWYSKVAPTSWFVTSHVHEGRGDLNFSDWPILDFEWQDMAFHDIREQLTKGAMPLRSYTLLHPEARLTPDEHDRLMQWAGESD